MNRNFHRRHYLTALAALLWLASHAAFAQSATVLREDTARAEPFADAAAAGRVAAGSRVMVVERRGTWVRIEQPAGWLRGLVLRAEGAAAVAAAGVAALPSGREGRGTAVTLGIRGAPASNGAARSNARLLVDAVLEARDTALTPRLERGGDELRLTAPRDGHAYVMALDGARLVWLHPRVDADTAPLAAGRTLRIPAYAQPPGRALPLLAIVADTPIDEPLPDKRLEREHVVLEPGAAGLPALARALTLGRAGCAGVDCPEARYGAVLLP